MDPYVIDIPYWKRFLLVQLIIAPFRAPKSAALYKEIWTPEGSPLAIHTANLAKKLQRVLGTSYDVQWAMRYQHPSIAETLHQWKLLAEAEELIVVPLYPQPASSTTTSTLEEVQRLLKNLDLSIRVKEVRSFYQDERYLDAVAATAGSFRLDEYDHFLFSFHGLPQRHILKDDPNGYCQLNNQCCATINDRNKGCYRAACFHTARETAGRLGIPQESYTVTFQSRLGRDPWVQPYTDEVLAQLAEKGVKNILAFSPAFVADCLETLYEIGTEYNELFRSHGGESVTLVPSLNDRDDWVRALSGLIAPSATLVN